MTTDELRRKIAEALGYKEVPYEADKFFAYWQDHETLLSYYDEDQLDKAGVPDWPGDKGDALDLCLEIGAVAIGEERGDPQVGAPHGYLAHFVNNPKGAKYATTPALALSELAYTALSAQGGAK